MHQVKPQPLLPRLRGTSPISMRRPHKNAYPFLASKKISDPFLCVASSRGVDGIDDLAKRVFLSFCRHPPPFVGIPCIARRDLYYNSSDRGWRAGRWCTRTYVRTVQRSSSGRGLPCCPLLSLAAISRLAGSAPRCDLSPMGITRRKPGGTSCPDFGRAPVEERGLVILEDGSLSGLSCF